MNIHIHTEREQINRVVFCLMDLGSLGVLLDDQSCKTLKLIWQHRIAPYYDSGSEWQRDAIGSFESKIDHRPHDALSKKLPRGLRHRAIAQQNWLRRRSVRDSAGDGMHRRNPVAAWLAGVDDFEGAHAGKPDCYGSWVVMAVFCKRMANTPSELQH
jgi:hypothetical protein